MMPYLTILTMASALERLLSKYPNDSANEVGEAASSRRVTGEIEFMACGIIKVCSTGIALGSARARSPLLPASFPGGFDPLGGGVVLVVALDI